MSKSGYFTRGIVILTILLMSVVVSFFLGKLLGNELMSGGKEQLQQFTASADESDETGSPLMGSLDSDLSYSGPTSDRFQITWADPIEDENIDENAVTIEPILPGDSESEDGDDSALTSLFSLDELAASDEPTTLYRIQVGVFEDFENAENFASLLNREEFHAYTQEVPDVTPAKWKVFVGPYKTEEAANAVAEKLRERNYDAYVN